MIFFSVLQFVLKIVNGAKSTVIQTVISGVTDWWQFEWTTLKVSHLWWSFVLSFKNLLICCFKTIRSLRFAFLVKAFDFNFISDLLEIFQDFTIMVVFIHVKYAWLYGGFNCRYMLLVLQLFLWLMDARHKTFLFFFTSNQQKMN